MKFWLWPGNLQHNMTENNRIEYKRELNDGLEKETLNGKEKISGVESGAHRGRVRGRVSNRVELE
jgi:hypothetical protein